MIHQGLREKGFSRSDYTLTASDDLTAEKIKYLEDNGADMDKYLVGTYVVNPPKPLGGVYKLAAFKDGNGVWQLRGKFSENPRKATLPGIKQVYRVRGSDGSFQRDIVALEGEDISEYIGVRETVEGLLIPVIKEGKQVYSFPSLAEISARREEQLRSFKNIGEYEIIISPGIKTAQEEVRRIYRSGS